MKFRAEHSFKGISLADYEKLYFDEPFNISLCKEVKLARALVERTDGDGHLLRIVTVGPDRELPRPVAKILGADRIEYTEHVDYDWGTFGGTWKTISSLLTEKVDTRGTFGFSETDGGVRRVIDGAIKVKLFGVGGVIEKFIVADIERSYDQAAQFTQRWIDQH